MERLIIRNKLAILGALIGVLIGTPALAQASFPTAASGVRAPGTVPLQCDASAANCAPPSAANPIVMAGNVASGTADSGNPVKVGGVFNTTQPTLTTGQRGDAQMTARGELLVSLSTGATSVNVATPSGDGVSVGTGGLLTRSITYGYNGTSLDRMRGDANGQVVQPGLTATFWYYTSGVTPILSNTTTGVTIKAAAGASVRNYIDSCQLTTTAFGASVPIALRDGTGGTVRWALTVPTAGFLQPVVVNFSPPLQGTANTLWEVATPTANTTGTVTLNCAGHTGI